MIGKKDFSAFVLGGLMFCGIGAAWAQEAEQAPPTENKQAEETSSKAMSEALLPTIDFSRLQKSKQSELLPSLFFLGEIRDELLSLYEMKISWYSFSSEQGKGAVDINGIAYYEGAELKEIKPGLFLEKVVEDGLILRFDNHRFRMQLKGSGFF